MKYVNNLTQEYLKSILEYNLETGKFIWLVKTSNRVKIGMYAGTLRNNGYLKININGQLYYAHKNISLKVVTSGIKLGPYGAGTNNWNWGIAIATSDNSTASFGTITEFATRSSTTYVSNAEYESNINQQIDIPAGRYFIIGNTYGPVYAAGKNYQYNRSAIINGEPYFTAINKCWSGGGNVTWEIPTQLGGTGSYSQSQPRVPMRSIKFSIT
jgi:hypothetical protein